MDKKMRSFNVGYFGDDTEYEAQFDIEDGDFVSMVCQLVDLYQDLIEECGYESARITEIYEVPYRGEEE